ncbi:helix-turn-helix domain-containing protein [Roseateles sp. LYH14W]|uniref:Helix-turn-helix domain-containing protein n=1 Tax=Pelomonas parva TaxID=3299032 RepID=A0ABW7FDU9_9BURK
MPRPPNLPIQGSIVRQLREERGLSQAELVTLVFRALPDAERRHVPERNALERQCYEWEQENNISRARLAALCQVLGVAADRLQVPPSPTPSRIDEIVERLKQQVAAGNERARQFLDSAAQCIYLGAVPQVEDPFLVAAEAIEVRLGGVQLTGGRVELEELAAVTGWTHAELFRTASVHAYWLVASESRLGGTTELVRGVRAAMALFEKEVERWTHFGDGDSQATLHEEPPWFRILLQDPDRPALEKTISLVRCEPQKSGLTYCSPTSEERWAVTVQNALALRSSFNFVRPLGDAKPWPRYEDMALELWDVSEFGEDDDLVFLSRFNGTLTHRIEDSLPRLVEARHETVMGWLTSGLAGHLLPHLKKWPRECWRVTSGSFVQVSLDVPWEIARYEGPTDHYGTRFAIQLVQVHADGTSTPLPLAGASLKAVRRRVEVALTELPLDSEFIGPRRPVGRASD